MDLINYTKIKVFDTQILDISKLPNKYTGIGTGQNIPISTAFPGVTLAQVQVLNASATLSDSADWYVLQKFINAATTNGDKKLTIPSGTYILSKTLDLTEKLGSGWNLEGTGVILKASTGFTGYLVTLSRGTDYTQCRNGYIKGLALDGNYTSCGFRINDAHEFCLTNVRVYRSFIGVHLTDTYYGEIGGESVLQDCLVGIKTTGNTSTEVNTVNFHNIKINFAQEKTHFIPKNQGESDEDYNNRVVSIGVNLETMIFGCKFYGLTLEGMDYGYYGLKAGTSGTNSSIFTIDKNYFEAITKQAIYLVSFDGYSNISFTCFVTNCRVTGNKPSTIGQGTWRFFGNEKFPLTIKCNGYSSTLHTDMPKQYISSTDTTDVNVTVYSNYIASSGNACKYSSFGNVNDYPSSTNHLPNIQDNLFVEHTPRLRTGTRSRTSMAMTVQTKPITFVPNYDTFNGPVIKGTDGNYYMMGTASGSALTLTKVSNLHRLEENLNSKTAKELYKMTGVADGTSYFCVDIQATVTYKSSTGKWVINYGLSTERTAIGTGAELSAVSPVSGSWGSPVVWNVQINYGYNSQDSFWGCGYDWYGNNAVSTRAIGTLAQRPSSPSTSGVIYYATDNSTYYQWSGSTWSTYTPIF